MVCRVRLKPRTVPCRHSCRRNLHPDDSHHKVPNHHERSPAHRMSQKGKSERRPAVASIVLPSCGGVQPLGPRRLQYACCPSAAVAGAMTPQRLETGDWFLVPENMIRPSSGRQRSRPFASKPGSRPVILSALGHSTVSTVLPRSTRAHAGLEPSCLHDRHSHRATYPDCCINEDGRVVYSPVLIQNRDLARHGPRCVEPDNTGLLEQIAKWTSV